MKKKTIVLHTNLEELHLISKQWLSEISFWKDEIHFMENLTRKYFIRFLSKDKNQTFQALVKKIKQIEREELEGILNSVLDHEMKLSRVIQDQFSGQEESYRQEHLDISNRIHLFRNNYNMVKSELFRLAEQVLRQEKFEKFIAANA